MFPTNCNNRRGGPGAESGSCGVKVYCYHVTYFWPINISLTFTSLSAVVLLLVYSPLTEQTRVEYSAATFSWPN